jgi:hypothetical protein
MFFIQYFMTTYKNFNLLNLLLMIFVSYQNRSIRLPEDDVDALKHVEYLHYIKILLMHIYAVHLFVWIINNKII